MEKLLHKIEDRVPELETTPFIVWLKNPAIPIEEKMTKWYHCCGVFAFGFKDINNLVFKYPDSEENTEPLKTMINNHAEEDGNHWKMYLKDLKTLDLDIELNLSSFFKYMYSDDTIKQRRFLYRLVQIAEIAKDPVERYCIIETIEIYGHFLFGILKDLSKEYEALTGKTLLYLGELHYKKETGLLVNQKSNDTQETVLSTFLSDRIRQKMEPLTIEVANLIENRWQEFYESTEKTGLF